MLCFTFQILESFSGVHVLLGILPVLRAKAEVTAVCEDSSDRHYVPEQPDISSIGLDSLLARIVKYWQFSLDAGRMMPSDRCTMYAVRTATPIDKNDTNRKSANGYLLQQRGFTTRISGPNCTLSQ